MWYLGWYRLTGVLCGIWVGTAQQVRYVVFVVFILVLMTTELCNYEGWKFNSGNYLFTTDTK